MAKTHLCGRCHTKDERREIYKPDLRRDAVVRVVRKVLIEKYRVRDVNVEARLGGPKGMTVTVSFPELHRLLLSEVQNDLSAYLFEAIVLTC